MAGKDPAFLFFSLDWLQMTAKLFPQEKGVLIDLLCHQHRDGSITDDEIRLARMVGLTVDQFQPIWLTIRLFFDNREGNLLVNLWLEEKMTNRSTGKSTNSHVRSILSRFAVLVRQTKRAAPEITEQIKKEFNVADYQEFELDEANLKLTNWWTDRYNQLVKLGKPNGPPKNNLVIENENENNRLDEVIGGLGEKGEGREESAGPGAPVWKEGDWDGLQVAGSRLPAAMMEIVVETFPDYPLQEFKDSAACWQFGYQLAQYRRWKWQSVLNGSMDQLLAEWREIVSWARGDPWYQAKPISFWNTNFQGLIQAKNNGRSQKNEPGKSELGTSKGRIEAAREW